MYTRRVKMLERDPILKIMLVQPQGAQALTFFTIYPYCKPGGVVVGAFRPYHQFLASNY